MVSIGKRVLRHSYLVDPALQGSVCRNGLVYGGVILLVATVGMFVPVFWQMDEPSPGAADQASIVMLYMHERFWPVALVCAIMIGVGSLKFSHRIAGPLVRYKRNLRLLSEGKLSAPLRTRPGDLLQDEVTCLNEAVAGVGLRLDAIRQAQLEVRREVTAMLDAASGRQREDLQRLTATCDQLEQAVRAFQHFDPGDERLPVQGRSKFAMSGLTKGT